MSKKYKSWDEVRNERFSPEALKRIDTAVQEALIDKVEREKEWPPPCKYCGHEGRGGKHTDWCPDKSKEK